MAVVIYPDSLQTHSARKVEYAILLSFIYLQGKSTAANILPEQIDSQSYMWSLGGTTMKLEVNNINSEEYDCSMNPILFCYEDCLGSGFRNTLCASMSAWCSRRINTSVSVSSPIRTELLCMADATPVWQMRSSA